MRADIRQARALVAFGAASANVEKPEGPALLHHTTTLPLDTSPPTPSCAQRAAEGPNCLNHMDTTPSSPAPKVGVIMGSTSDWETMRHALETLHRFGVPAERSVISAHRAPDRLAEYARSARARGLKCIIAGAGGAAHLAGVTAAMTELPVLGVPIESTLKGLDSLLSIVQMPGGIPVATFAIGRAGAINAALFAVAMLALEEPALADKLSAFRREQTQKVLDAKLP
jgi:5-(carboxyamino)imidazole ribonucleotide mutase